MHLKKPIIIIALVALTAGNAAAHCPTFGGGGLGVAGPISTFSAGTLPEGKSAVGISYQLTGYDRLTPAKLESLAVENREAHTLSRQHLYSLNGGYGVTDNLTVALQLPYVSRDDVGGVHLHDGMGMAHRYGTLSGIGDLTIFGQYRLARQATAGVELSLLAGVKAPTGETGLDKNGAKISVEHQPGTGSWDPLAGFAVAHQEGRLSLHLNGLYSLATSGSRSTNIGDRAQWNAAAVYRIGGKDNYGDCDEIYEYFYPETRTRLLTDLVLELNGTWQDRLVRSGSVSDSWGGTILYVSPGIRATLDNRYATYISVGIPVVQELRGRQAEASFRVLAGVSVGF